MCVYLCVYVYVCIHVCMCMCVCAILHRSEKVKNFGIQMCGFKLPWILPVLFNGNSEKVLKYRKEPIYIRFVTHKSRKKHAALVFPRLVCVCFFHFVTKPGSLYGCVQELQILFIRPPLDQLSN
jgi:hypothetical protein